MKLLHTIILYTTLLTLLCGLKAETSVAAKRPDYVPSIHHELHRRYRDHQEQALEFQAMADSLTHINNTNEEVFELFPAMDLYTVWDDDHVDPLIGKGPVHIPDTMDIDVSHFFPPIKGAITSPYGWRHRRMHKGTDIKLYTGDTVYAAFTGRVRIKKFDRRGYGYYLVLRHSNGLETVYGHLSRFIANQDDLVKAGDPIALGGSTGRSTGPHLHFEMRFMGIALDPSTIINFNTFEPKSPTYKFHARAAQAAQRGGTAAQRGGNTYAGSSGSALYHKVRKGDTLGKIAQRYGTTVGKLCKLNQIRSTQTLRVGQRIRYK
jgi:murein DD-endopeptidase MepM/ murein hydrolase activator NlpD